MCNTRVRWQLLPPNQLNYWKTLESRAAWAAMLALLWDTEGILAESVSGEREKLFWEGKWELVSWVSGGSNKLFCFKALVTVNWNMNKSAEVKEVKIGGRKLSRSIASYWPKLSFAVSLLLYYSQWWIISSDLKMKVLQNIFRVWFCVFRVWFCFLRMWVNSHWHGYWVGRSVTVHF